MHKYILKPAYVRNNLLQFYKYSCKTIGTGLTNGLIKKSVYTTYCGGENIKELSKIVNVLHDKNIKPMMTYSMENINKGEHCSIISCQEKIKREIFDCINIKNYEGFKPIYALKITSIIDYDDLSDLGKNYNEYSFNRIYAIVKIVAKLIVDNNALVVVDAEDVNVQSAIRMLGNKLMQEFNGNDKYNIKIYLTYQCYRKDTYDNVDADLRLAKTNGYIFSPKFVRGAYMVIDKKIKPEIFHENIQSTHYCYDYHVEKIIKKSLPLFVASHNKITNVKLVDLMKNYCDKKNGLVRIGQMLGMADDTTEFFAKNGYDVYKSITYGPIHITMPYLLRRLDENADMLKYLTR